MAEVTEQVIHDIMTPVIKLGVTAQEIDDAVNRAKTGGVIDALIAEKAPAGFGLGSASTDKVITSKAELDAIRVNGWCYYNGAESLVAEANVLRATIRTDTSGRTITQTAYPFLSAFYQNCTLQRTLVDAIASNQTKEWGAWEWVNPPMDLGVEYRTTERYLGKPVYAKLVDCGALPNATSKVVEHGIANMSKIVSFSLCGFVGRECTYFLPSDGNYITRLSCSDRVIVVVAVTDMSSYTGSYAMIKYTKTTD